MNRKLLPLLIIGVAIAATRLFPEQPRTDRSAETDHISTSDAGSSAIDRAFEAQRSNVQVHGRGTVANVLKDDNDGSRHQRFVLRLASGRTVLVAHNIDLAPRVEPLTTGDAIDFAGEYEWNAKGGVLHWTHRDPAGRHPGGWLELNGRRFE